MEDIEGLIEKARQLERSLSNSATNKENVLIASHHDADGMCAAVLLADYILKLGGHCQIRTTSEPNPRFLDKLKSSRFDRLIFVDICSCLSTEIEKQFGDKWVIIDHHEILEEEKDTDRILNPWQFSVDGGTNISSAGLAYFITEKTRSPIAGFLAVIGALGDRQDVGPRRSLIGINSRILEEDAASFGMIDSRVDLLFWGKESRPAHESIANTVSCYIPGLTGNKDACLASLRGAGIDLKNNNRWKTISDFTEEEKQQLLESVVPHLAGTTNTVEDLVGTAYLLKSADEYSLLRDARDASAILNACGRIGKPGLGLSMCFGSESSYSNGLEAAFSDYRSELIRSVQSLMSSEERIQERSGFVLVIGDGIVSERMTGAACQAIASSARVKNKVVFLRTTTIDGDVKVSARLGRDVEDCNLGRAMIDVARATSGVGGGLQSAAGARFSIVKQQEFQVTVDGLFPNRK